MKLKKTIEMKNLIMLGILLFLAKAGISQTTWHEVATGVNNQLNTISWGSPTVGYIGGEDSLLLKSTDGGASWNQINFTGVDFLPGGEHIVGLKFIDENIGYMTVGPYSGTYKTIDGGLTWTSLTMAGNLCYNQGMYFFDENNGFIGGSGCFQGEAIEIMSAGIISTATINTPSWDANDLVVAIDFLDANFGLAVSEGSRVLRTTDGGLNWDTIPVPLLPQDVPLTSIVIVNDTLAYAGYDPFDAGFSGFGVLETNDGGLTWDWNMESATFFYPAFYSLHQSADGKIYSGAGTGTSFSPGLIFEGFNEGFSLYAEVDQPIFAMDSYGDSIVWAVGDSGYVVVNHPPANLGFETAPEAGSFEVFPNPAREEINILLENENLSENIKIIVMNVNGQVLINQSFVMAKLDVSNLASGLYIIQVVDGQKSYTSKFMKK